MNIESARALVTGGSSGIGLATARLLASRGARVAICGRDRAKLERAAKEIGALAVPADVGREGDRRPRRPARAPALHLSFACSARCSSHAIQRDTSSAAPHTRRANSRCTG